ncbi:pentapeptide repeat-containing protein [Micromonospora sp. NPDC053740]|uniref:pentapeptide repeat-containing protein n=1 Tax=Micromonospora TaxID=1873 RepID=UPI001EE7AA91|nr:pentapeptide repeat-containing protein [Micromonospora alfalfae]MCG5466804.1 pentapeptide repeat-containing protein [Micromonospora alfalfae]
MAEQRIRGVRPWVWAVGGFVGGLLLAFALVVGPWLLTRYPHQGLTAEQKLKARNDVRTTLVQALAGLAVAGGLVVTYSTYRQNQRDQADRRIEQDRSHGLSVARHVNDLYMKAIEQLGHAQAPVRLGALYSLAQLAQANPGQRQTVVDVMCAYLRMPYSVAGPATPAATEEHAQQLQVRLTAQRLLVDHLCLPRDVSAADARRAQHRAPSEDDVFWPGISLDLTGASLVDCDFAGLSVLGAVFDRARFTASTIFNDATFFGFAGFRGASFEEEAVFDKATFAGHTDFRGATFVEAGFVSANFHDGVWFDKAVFKVDVNLAYSCYGGYAVFREVAFNGGAWFDMAHFSDSATFEGATFSGGVSFQSDALLDAMFNDARVLPPSDEYLESGRDVDREWPPGWTVQPDEDDRNRGTLVRLQPNQPSEVMQMPITDP